MKLGRSSVNTIEVLEGLKVGDQVILSDMSAQDAHNRIRLNYEWGKDNMSANDSLLRLDGVTKVFVTDEVETHALAGIHMEIKSGEYVSISGPSGCGKSTLLAILGLLDSPTDGTFLLNGKPVQGLKMSERARIRNREIGFIFQAFNLIGDLTVYENVELPLTYRGMPSAERKKRVQEALERVGMSHRMKHYPSQLSGGQQQRVAVARALGGEPSILLADEPTGNLDSANGEAVMDLLRDLHRSGATICMVTHDPRYARYAERTIHLFDGASSKRALRKADTRDSLEHDFSTECGEILRARPDEDVRPAPGQPRHQGRRLRFHHGPVGRRQIDAAACHRHA